MVGTGAQERCGEWDSEGKHLGAAGEVLLLGQAVQVVLRAL